MPMCEFDDTWQPGQPGQSDAYSGLQPGLVRMRSSSLPLPETG